MVIAHHLMWTLYGWWLPNDPRGSTSHVIRNDLLRELGDLHFGRKRVQPAGRDIRGFYQQAGQVLRHELLTFHPDEFAMIAAVFEVALRERGYTCYALSIMPDHVHLCIRKHKDLAEAMIDHLQSLTRLGLSGMNLRAPDHPAWTRGGWKVFLDTPGDVRRTIEYVEQNPVKIGLPVQRWPFVVKYDDWPLHKAR